MPPDFIRSIFPRRLRHRDGEEAVISPIVGQASDEAKTDAPQDPPPPYTSENQALVDDSKTLVSKPSSDPSNTARVSSTQPDDKPSPSDSKPSFDPSKAPRVGSTQSDSEPSSSGSIQFCPHTTSSFDRIQRIVRLPNFKASYEGIDALTPGPEHRDPFASGFKQCKPASSSDLRITGWGKYLYDKYGTASLRKDETLPGHGEGLVLQFHWTFSFLTVPPTQRQSADKIRGLLSQAGIQLCAHSRLSDPTIVAAVYRLLNPGDDDLDPIDKWGSGGDNSTTIVACDECASFAELRGVNTTVSVDTRRFLGRGESVTDPVWLAQCGARGATAAREELV